MKKGKIKVCYGILLFLFIISFIWIDPLLAAFFYNFHFPKKFPIINNFLLSYEKLLHLPSLILSCFCFCFLFFNRKKRQYFILKNTLSILLSISSIYLLVFFVLKPLWNRPRPIETYIYNQREIFVPFYKIDINSTWSQRNFSSFPSGHAATSTSLLSILPVFERYKKKKLYKIFVYLFIPFISIQSLFRMILGKHFLSDIFLGIILTYLEIQLINKIIFKKTINKKIMSFDI